MELFFLYKNSLIGVFECKVIYERMLFFLFRKLNKFQLGKEDGKVSKDKKKKKKKYRKKFRSLEEGQYQYIIKFLQKYIGIGKVQVYVF